MKELDMMASKRKQKESINLYNNSKLRMSKAIHIFSKWFGNTKQLYSEVCKSVGLEVIAKHVSFYCNSPITQLENPIPDKINLFIQYYVSPNPSRFEEIKKCLQINFNNPFINKIYLLNEREYTNDELGNIDNTNNKLEQIIINKRLSYQDVFNIIEDKQIKGYCILSNSDIFFDKSISILDKTGLANNKKMFALLRYEYKPGLSLKDSPIFDYRACSQDTWIWHSNYNINKEHRHVFDFQLGIPGCDNTVAYLFQALGFNCHNEPLLIKTYHYHTSQVRNYNENTEKTLQPYFEIFAPMSHDEKNDPEHPFNFYGENLNFYNFLKEKIESNNNFIVPREAGIENVYAMIGVSAMQRGSFNPEETHYINNTRAVMKNNAGIFLQDGNSVVDYAKEYLEAFHRCDGYFDWEPQGPVAQGIVFNSFEFVQANFLNKKRFWSFGPLDIFHNVCQEIPWTFALKGKRLLIISPFEETFRKQLPHLSKIYGRDLFPDCTFEFIRPPQTQGKNNSKPFMDELNEFTEKLFLIRDKFDIALVSCGGYGNPILGRLHKIGKSAIYVGGVLQMFFGVYGSRWERERPLMMKLFKNEYWVRPTADERPAGFENVEGSCYW